MRTLRAALVVLALLPASCAGGTDEPGPAPVAGFDATEQAGRQLRCSDWQDADPAGRRAIVDGLREFLGGPVSGEGVSGRGSVLEDDEAHQLFNARCRDFPGFLLYKLYSHAAAFAGHTESD